MHRLTLRFSLNFTPSYFNTHGLRRIYEHLNISKVPNYFNQRDMWTFKQSLRRVVLLLCTSSSSRAHCLWRNVRSARAGAAPPRLSAENGHHKRFQVETRHETRGATTTRIEIVKHWHGRNSWNRWARQRSFQWTTTRTKNSQWFRKSSLDRNKKTLRAVKRILTVKNHTTR